MVKNELIHMDEALQALANESRQVPASIGVHSTLWMYLMLKLTNIHDKSCVNFILWLWYKS